MPSDHRKRPSNTHRFVYVAVSGSSLGTRKIISSFHWPTSLSRTLSSGVLAGPLCAFVSPSRDETPHSSPNATLTSRDVLFIGGSHVRTMLRPVPGGRHSSVQRTQAFYSWRVHSINPAGTCLSDPA